MILSHLTSVQLYFVFGKEQPNPNISSGVVQFFDMIDYLPSFFIELYGNVHTTLTIQNIFKCLLERKVTLDWDTHPLH